MLNEQFEDRREAGRMLAERLAQYAGRPDVLVLALPRGGVAVGYEVARRLGAPLDVLVVRKLGVPHQPELAMGAIAPGGVVVLNRPVIVETGVDRETLAKVADRERRELQRRERVFRGDRPAPDLADRTALLVDDGLATGASMRAAVTAARRGGAGRVVVAMPVAAQESAAELAGEVDEFHCLFTPHPFIAIGRWYADFTQVQDTQVRELLEAAEREWRAGAERSGRPARMARPGPERPRGFGDPGFGASLL